jgi:ABC-type polysaccharide/polyol phosphate transport system ATPase subunit
VSFGDTVVWVRELDVSYRRRRYPATRVKDVATNIVRGRHGYDAYAALTDVSVRVRRGEVVGVIGANGAGKSTLLKVLAKVLPPTRGRVVVHGTVAPMIELGAGFDSELSAEENVVLYGALLGREPREVRRRATDTLAWAGLLDFAAEPLRTFSSGMLARLAFAIAADCDPDVVLIDEVLAVGDLAFRARSTERIGELVSGGAAVVLVSHAPEAIEALAHRVLWLDRGRVVACGRPTAVLDAYRRCSLSGRDEVEAIR